MKEGNIRESIPGVSRFWADETEGESCGFGMLGTWWTNGLSIRMRLEILSNFHVENILIRITD